MKEVQAATREELDYMEAREICEVCSIQQCWDQTGQNPTSVRWVDTQKADGVRARLVATDFKSGDNGRDDFFAATPPLKG